jgi:protoheme IX farnesyltransferase
VTNRAFASSAPSYPSQGEEAQASDFLALLKPRVMSLVVFTSFVGLWLAPGAMHPMLGFVALLCIAVGAGASASINMWFDADIDAVMKRTRLRPIPQGRISPTDALGLGVTLSVGSVTMMALAVNWTAAALLAGTIGFYVFIYTMWLKRRTPQNIVIGGAAGAFPPMVGWAAVTGGVSLESIVLFAIIFIWTPPHFWALALYRNEDYQRAGVPMLPVVAGLKETRRQILIYSLILAPVTLTPWFIGMSSWLYGLAAGSLGLVFIGFALAVWREGEGDKSLDKAQRLFGFSILYLFLIFVLLVADRLVAMHLGGLV